MEDLKPLDKFDHYPEGKGNQTIKLFLISLVLAFIGGLTLLLYSTVGLPHESIISLLPASGIASFAISIGGLNVGVSEIKYSTNWVKTGIIGNLIVILIPTVYVLYQIVTIVMSIFYEIN